MKKIFDMRVACCTKRKCKVRLGMCIREGGMGWDGMGGGGKWAVVYGWNRDIYSKIGEVGPESSNTYSKTETGASKLGWLESLLLFVFPLSSAPLLYFYKTRFLSRE